MGNRFVMLCRAVELLNVQKGLTVRELSPVYETEPIGGPQQDKYLNAALLIETTLEPETLLDCCMRIEDKLGRVRYEICGPRTIDIDLLMYGDKIIQTDRLTIPHPRMAERAFVVYPLTDIAPDLVHPVLNDSISVLSKRLNSTGIHRLDDLMLGSNGCT